MYEVPDNHGLGRVPNSPDERDKLYPMRAVIPTEVVPRTRRFWAGEDYRTLEKDAFVLDQGATGTCVGMCWTHFLNDAPVIQPNLALGEDYARQLYVEASGDTTLQEGTYTRLVVDVLRKRGLISSYNWAQGTDDIVDHLLYRGPVGFACSWTYGHDYPLKLTWVDGTTRYYLTKSGESRGGHAFVLDGVYLTPPVGPPFVRMRNSWGKGWCRGGFASISIEELGKMFADWGDAVVATEVQYS